MYKINRDLFLGILVVILIFGFTVHTVHFRVLDRQLEDVFNENEYLRDEVGDLRQTILMAHNDVSSVMRQNFNDTWTEIDLVSSALRSHLEDEAIKEMMEMQEREDTRGFATEIRGFAK